MVERILWRWIMVVIFLFSLWRWTLRVTNVRACVTFDWCEENNDNVNKIWDWLICVELSDDKWGWLCWHVNTCVRMDVIIVDIFYFGELLWLGWHDYIWFVSSSIIVWVLNIMKDTIIRIVVISVITCGREIDEYYSTQNNVRTLVLQNYIYLFME